MNVRYAKSQKQPALNSYYVSQFTSATLELIKSARPLSTYHRQAQEFELPRETYERIKEPVYRFVDQAAEYPVFERKSTAEYGYQDDAVEFLRKTRNALINFEQGMGKSLTTMKVILDRQIRKTLVICGQSNLQEEWLKDARKHGLADKLNIRIVGDDSDAGNPKKLKWLATHQDEAGVDLINVEALRNPTVVEQLNACHYDCIVFDEVQAAKGWKAQQTQGFQEIARTPGQYRIALSGTPVLNSPFEFFSVLKFFGVLGDTARTTFEKYYGEWGFDFWGHYVCKAYRNVAELKELLSPVICPASKDELHLQPKTRKRVLIDYDSEHYNMLSKVYKYSTARLKKAGFASKPEVRAKMQYLSATAEGKMRFVLERAREGKLLVFSEYTQVLDAYSDYLKAAGVSFLYYSGKQGMKERLEILSKWREGQADVLLMSVGASRYGLNLTEAKQVVFVDIPPNLSVIAQCEDRAHRIGQTEPVTSYLLVATPLDESALDLVKQKQESLDALLDQ